MIPKPTQLHDFLTIPAPVFPFLLCIQYDRVILDFGDVTCTGTQTDHDDCRIYIRWDTIMVENDATTNDTTYWLSSGAEYNNDDEVWVGQASVTAVTKAGEGGDWVSAGAS